MASPAHAHAASPAHRNEDAAAPARPAARRAGKGEAMGNLALQDLVSLGLLRTRLVVGPVSDPAEAEADRMADAAVSASPVAAAPAHAGGAATIRRKPRTHDLLGSVTQVTLGGDRPLAQRERAFFEPRFKADLGDVRVHDNPHAAASAAGLNARAFSLGSRIAFGAGEYRPDSPAGQRLLAHELAHVLQADSAPVIRRAPLATPLPSGPMCKPEPAPAPEEQMCKLPEKEDPSNPTVLDLKGSLSERVASFKQLVKTTAIHRLLDNRLNLSKWAELVKESIPAEDLAAIGMMETGASRPYFELQDIRDPLMRELRAAQALGQFRACTGCHLETQIGASRSEREGLSFEAWRTPNEMRAGVKPVSRFELFASGMPSATDLARLTGSTFSAGTAEPAKPMPTGPLAYKPAGTQETRLHRLFPDPAATREALKRAAPIMEALGDEGYQVLPKDLLGKLEGASAAKVRQLILDAIETRRGNYMELIEKIKAGEIGYEFFGPIVKKLFPLADDEVRKAIQDEMDREGFWAKVEQVVVAAMTALALILAIFPPTSAAGIALFASLEISLGYYGIQKGKEARKLGEAYKLGVGAHDVFTKEQQQSADAMILSGYLSEFTGYLGVGGGLLRTIAVASHFKPPPTAASLTESTALARSTPTGVAGTIQRGEYVMTVADDGAMMVTASSRPDLLIMVRGETATLYQLLEGGGMRVVARATLPNRAARGNALLTAGDEFGTGVMFTPREGPLTMPAPREPLRLGSGAPTTYTWDEISRMRQPQLWQEREIYMQQLYGAPGHQHFPVPGTGGRYVDVPVDVGGGYWFFAGEVKSYSRWIGVPGQRGGILNEVGLSERIQEQIARDVWLRNNVPGFDPRWMFTDAPPSAALRQALRDARIPFIEYL